MTNEQLDNYIDQLNSGDYNPETIFLSKISNDVLYARIWTKEPEVTDQITGFPCSYEFFFIKDENDKFIGTVLDMASDLHWYIKKEFRKQGYLSRALRQTILPFLFRSRTEQRVTIPVNDIGKEEYEKSRSVALSLGFKAVDENYLEFKLSKHTFNLTEVQIDRAKELIDRARLEILRKKVSFSMTMLMTVSDELKMKNLDDFGLEEQTRALAKYLMFIEDIPYDYQN